LVDKYFGSQVGSDYLVTIVRRDDPAEPVFSSQNDLVIDEASADVIATVFDLRPDDVRRLMTMKPLSEPGRAFAFGESLPPGPPRGRTGSSRGEESGPVPERFAVTTFVRKAGGTGGVLLAGGPGEGAWQVRVRHRSGSLESIVTRSRHRNLAISLG